MKMFLRSCRIYVAIRDPAESAHRVSIKLKIPVQVQMLLLHLPAGGGGLSDLLETYHSKFCRETQEAVLKMDPNTQNCYSILLPKLSPNPNRTMKLLQVQ